LEKESKVARFEQSLLPHLGAAYNLARWLLRNPADAEDVVQESYLRAFRFFGGYHGGDIRAWLLTIVRNTTYTWLQQNRSREFAEPFNDEVEEIEDDALDPETLVIQAAGIEALRTALDELPIEFREVMALREFEDLSYKEIAAIVEVPIGTVMSRLARARKRLQEQLADLRNKGVSP
jgi:RNA polymerase sigma-70 factor (ECF subfamily)